MRLLCSHVVNIFLRLGLFHEVELLTLLRQLPLDLLPLGRQGLLEMPGEEPQSPGTEHDSISEFDGLVRSPGGGVGGSLLLQPLPVVSLQTPPESVLPSLRQTGTFLVVEDLTPAGDRSLGLLETLSEALSPPSALAPVSLHSAPGEFFTDPGPVGPPESLELLQQRLVFFLIFHNYKI